MYVKSGAMELRSDLAVFFPGADPFPAIMSLEGRVYREKEGRRTLRFERGGQGYFAKIYRGVGWREIVRNLCRLSLPVVDATTELRAIRRLDQLGVSSMTVAGFGRRGRNPARRESFLITDELVGMPSLETFCRDWPANPPPPRLKREIIRRVAAIARTLHANGVNHRDLYLCHLLIDAGGSVDPATLRLHLIDLHRVQMRSRTPLRWAVKDLGGLLFSSVGIGLSVRDLYRFMSAYRQRELRDILTSESRFWRKVVRRALRFYRRDFGAATPLPGSSKVILRWV